MSFIEDRQATFAMPDSRRFCRPDLTGVGMGGLIKPFLRRLAFDPVVAAAFIDDALRRCWSAHWSACGRP
eukprot:694984-Alexandrium_andersonii.AAC.1